MYIRTVAKVGEGRCKDGALLRPRLFAEFAGTREIELYTVEEKVYPSFVRGGAEGKEVSPACSSFAFRGRSPVVALWRAPAPPVPPCSRGWGGGGGSPPEGGSGSVGVFIISRSSVRVSMDTGCPGGSLERDVEMIFHPRDVKWRRMW